MDQSLFAIRRLEDIFFSAYQLCCNMVWYTVYAEIPKPNFFPDCTYIHHFIEFVKLHINLHLWIFSWRNSAVDGLNLTIMVLIILNAARIRHSVYNIIMRLLPDMVFNKQSLDGDPWIIVILIEKYSLL